MLQSMTGFGNATSQSEAAYVAVELKAVNNRYLKVSMRLPDFLARFEADLEQLIREQVGRGTVNLSIRCRLNAQSSGYSIDASVLRRYAEQSAQFADDLGKPAPDLADFLSLPGVITEQEVTPDLLASVFPVIKSTVQEALDQFDEFRRKEGESMLSDLAGQCSAIETQVELVAEHTPEVVADYREKMLDRVRRTLADTDANVSENDLIREVAVFADKCDINEEITRLGSHIDQFRQFLDSEKSMGRKLEFLGQEMFREINTIGSKANNVTIAHSVVEMKGAIERIREILQNVE